MNEILQVLQTLCLISLFWIASKQRNEIRQIKRFIAKFEDLPEDLLENNPIRVFKMDTENQEYLRDCLKEIQNKK